MRTFSQELGKSKRLIAEGIGKALRKPLEGVSGSRSNPVRLCISLLVGHLDHGVIQASKLLNAEGIVKALRKHLVGVSGSLRNPTNYPLINNINSKPGNIRCIERIINE